VRGADDRTEENVLIPQIVTPFRSHDPFRTARITAVLTAALFGLAASSALVIGAAVGSFWDPPRSFTLIHNFMIVWIPGRDRRR